MLHKYRVVCSPVVSSHLCAHIQAQKLSRCKQPGALTPNPKSQVRFKALLLKKRWVERTSPGLNLLAWLLRWKCTSFLERFPRPGVKLLLWESTFWFYPDDPSTYPLSSGIVVPATGLRDCSMPLFMLTCCLSGLMLVCLPEPQSSPQPLTLFPQWCFPAHFTRMFNLLCADPAYAQLDSWKMFSYLCTRCFSLYLSRLSIWNLRL